MKRIKDKLSQLSYLPRGATIVWNATGMWSIVWLSIIVIAGLLPAGAITLTKRLVDAMVTATRARGSWETVKPLLLVAGAVAGVSLLIELLQGAAEWLRAVQAELIQDHLADLIQAKAMEVDFAFYEAPEYYDCMYRARDDAYSRIVALLEHSGAVCQNAITLLALTGIVAVYNGFLVAAMVISVVPAFYVIARYNWLTHQWWNRTTSERRWIQYYDAKFTNGAAAAEIRLFRLGPHFQAAYRGLRKSLRQSYLALVRKQNQARLATALLSVVVAGVAIAWVGHRTLVGEATFGDMALFYQAFLGGQGFMRVVTLSLGQVYGKSLFLKDLCDFLALKSTIKDPPNPLPAPETLTQGIEFRDVTFRYPGSDRIALQNLDIFIPAGKIVAVVGPNGAGKSTLIKLVSRFYDPSEGAITIDGTSLRDMRVDSVRSLLSILFQHPVNYDATVKENIAIGALDQSPSDTLIKQAAERSGITDVVNRLPNGYDTRLGKAFAEGTDLSSGEWQRVAMARAFLRNAPIILLDEPTSFMDAWAEVEWFDRLRLLAAGRTAMVVTHRFTIAMRADLIHVMYQGRVVESGSHEELLAQNGLYAQSWRDQMTATTGSSESLYAAV